MTARITRLLTTTALAISALTMGGCALIESNVSSTTLSIIEDGFTPPTLKMGDVEMACNFSVVNTPLVGAARNFYGDPSLIETVMLSSAGVCSENHAMTDEMRYLRASREKRADELGEDEGRDAGRRDPGEGVGQASGQRHRRIGEGCRGGEPVGGRDVEADQHGDGVRLEAQPAEDGEEQAEGCYRLRRPLRRSRANRLRDLEDR